MRRTLTLVFAAATMLASAEGTALAEPGRGQAQGRALDLFEQSAKAYREGRFQEAVDLLLEAHRIKSEPVLLYNLGRAYEALGKPTEAADAYEGYLKEDPRAADRKAIEGRIATLRAQAAELEKARTAPPPPPLDEHRDRSSDPTPAPTEPESPSIVPWIVAGAGVAVMGGGIVMGVLANSRHDDAVAEPRQAAAQDKQDSAETLATGATIMILVGGVATAVGLGWLGVRAFSASPAPSSARGLRIAPGLGSIVLGGRF